MGKVLIGPAGWHYPDWAGIVYPQHKPKSFSELGFLADFIDIAEVNSTFYRIPEPRIAKNWIVQISHNPRFQFIVKLWQGFTHERRGTGSLELAKYKALIDPLHEEQRLATILVQFPWSWKASRENLVYLLELCKALAPYSCHVEFRHASWHSPDLLSRLHDQQIGWVNIDQPVIGASLGPTQVCTATNAYFRFHGRNYANWFREGSDRNQRYDYLYSAPELAEWLPRIEEGTAKADKSFVIFNNHFRGQALVNSLQMIALLSEAPISIPSSLAHHYPELARPWRSPC